jgi:acyl-coenzyme A synthetase/AMP-(fatty) acid ligase/3-hydroxymyristoyl/3-hydroxydecanoyl-(acyl carrier protein) dehydratase
MAESLCEIRPDTLANLPLIVASRATDFVVGWRDDKAVRNAEFLLRSAAWRNLLQRTPGSNFALYLEDSIEFGAALLGAWQAGKTIWLTADTLAASCAALAVDGFLGEFAPEWQALLPDAEDEQNAVQFSDTTPLDENFAALVVHTSGTTGVAQAIPKRLTQLSSEVATLESLFGSALGDATIVATVSHQHIYGLLFKVLWPLMAGRAVHARMQNFPEELLKLMARNPCALVASPAYLKRLPDHLEWSAVAGLRAVFSSGGPLSAEVAQHTGKLLGRIPVEIYGSSETGGIAWRQRSGSSDESWLPLPGVAWRITADEHLLEVRSPHLADDNWLRMADCIEAHGDQRFMLSGRSDRIVKIEEKRISLNAIESLLSASELVSSARVLLCDEVAGQRQRLAAFIVLSPQGRDLLDETGKRALNQQLRDLLQDTIEPVAWPRRWRYLQQMPTDAQGKTTRALLLALLDERPRLPHVQVLSRAALRVELSINVPANLLYFDGHFSQAPILPGVVQVDWAIHYGRQYFDLLPRFLAINALKFQHVIQPERAITLELNHDTLKNSLNFRYFSSSGAHASGRILFGMDADA